MSFFERIGEGLAFAHREAAKHITAENINRGAQEAWKAVDYAAQQAQQHVTAENINRGAQEALKAVDFAKQQIQQHVTPENIGRAAEEVRKNWDNAARGLAEAAGHAQPHVARAVSNAGDAIRGAASQVTAENIAIGAGIAREHITNAAEHIGREIGSASSVVHHGVEEAASWAKDEKNIQGIKDGAQAAAQGAAHVAKNNTAAIAIASAGTLIAVAPAIVTAPIIGTAGMLGFTSGGIAASSVAAGVQASVGNVAAGSAFATVQSAAAGGYGLAVLTGIVQATGGAIAAVGGIGGGVLAWLKG